MPFHFRWLTRQRSAHRHGRSLAVVLLCFGGHLHSLDYAFLTPWPFGRPTAVDTSDSSRAAKSLSQKPPYVLWDPPFLEDADGLLLWRGASVFTAKVGDDALGRRLASFCMEHSRGNKGVVVSNEGGWHSEDLLTHPANVLAELRDLLHCPLAAFMSEQRPDLVPGSCSNSTSQIHLRSTVDKLWANINRPGNWNKRHSHGSSSDYVASGVYYPAGCTYDNEARLLLYPEGEDVIEVFPEAGMVVLFPPDLKHEVAPVPPGSAARISYAFNLNARWLTQPLHLAAAVGDVAAITSLIQGHANVDADEPDFQLGFSPLHLAAEAGHVAAVRVLAELGANPMVVTRNSQSPLSLATFYGHTDVVRYLLGQSDSGQEGEGALVTERLRLASRAAATKAIVVAQDQGFAKLEALLKGPAVGSWFQLAVAGGYSLKVKLLLNDRANPSERIPGSARTPLMDAAALGHVSIMKLLLGAGADAEAQDKFGKCAAHHAAAHGHAAAIRYLSEVRPLDTSGLTTSDREFSRPIHWAARFGHVEGVVELAAAGVELEPMSTTGQALDWATRAGHSDVVMKLLELGANATSRE